MIASVQPWAAQGTQAARGGGWPLSAKICLVIGLLLIVIGGGLVGLGANIDAPTAKWVLVQVGGSIAFGGLVFAPTSVFVMRRFAGDAGYSKGEGLGLYLGWIFAVVGLGLLLGLGHNLPGEFALAFFSVEVKGEVTRVKLGGPSKTRAGGIDATEIYFRCKHRGRSYRDYFATFDDSKVARYRKGEPIRCEVSPLWSGYARAKGERYSIFGWWGLLALLPLSLGTGGALSSIMRKRRRLASGGSTTPSPPLG